MKRAGAFLRKWWNCSAVAIENYSKCVYATLTADLWSVFGICTVPRGLYSNKATASGRRGGKASSAPSHFKPPQVVRKVLLHPPPFARPTLCQSCGARTTFVRLACVSVFSTPHKTPRLEPTCRKLWVGSQEVLWSARGGGRVGWEGRANARVCGVPLVPRLRSHRLRTRV